MRIWSKRLIEYLPNKQLLAMRYELGDMIKQYPNIKNGLVKFANNYDCNYLYDYFLVVNIEINKRNLRINEKYNVNISSIVKSKTKKVYLPFKEIYVFNEDNPRYLIQNLYNLQEKHDRGLISDEDWKKIDKFWDGLIF